MPESPRFIGADSVIESGSIILSSGDSDFRIQISDLTFEIILKGGRSGGAVQPIAISPNKMQITISTFYTSNLAYKFKVGTLWNKELYLALIVETKQGAFVVTYTFTTKGP